jgi:hypothetical protein
LNEAGLWTVVCELIGKLCGGFRVAGGRFSGSYVDEMLLNFVESFDGSL